MILNFSTFHLQAISRIDEHNSEEEDGEEEEEEGDPLLKVHNDCYLFLSVD